VEASGGKLPPPPLDSQVLTILLSSGGKTEHQLESQQ
jgi:hypothetical protein